MGQQVSSFGGMTAVDLFAGAGGLALGVAKSGFRHLAVVERDHFACETIRKNIANGHPLVQGWPVLEQDVQELDYSQLPVDIDLLCAGVPCQPFSVAGKGQADQDERDMFAEVVRAARELRPKAILVENVRGLHRSKFRQYLEYILLAIASPGLARVPHEGWIEHFAQLRRRSGVVSARPALRYDVHLHVVNAADFGIPQHRERLFIVAFRSDLGVHWDFPKVTHSMRSLLRSQWSSMDYWVRHGLRRKRPGKMSRRLHLALRRLDLDVADDLLPWRTVRDVISDLPTPSSGRAASRPMNHQWHRAARRYKGHVGSLLDEPSKTLKAGSHGVPGGENCLDLGQRARYFTIRECARIQTFPDNYEFVGPWIRMMRQVGNAVPVDLGQAIASSIRKHLSSVERRRNTAACEILEFVPTHNGTRLAV